MVIRVLCLPGYGQNSITFHRKFAAVQKNCKNTEFVILDPPHILLAAHDPSDLSATPMEPISESSPPELIPRAWWRSNAEKTVYYGLDETLLFLKEKLEAGAAFDGILGFSQGAAMAALLVALLEKPDVYSKIRIEHPPVRFGVYISGFKPLHEDLAPLFSTPLVTPSLHILGRADVIVGSKRSQSLVDACAKPRVESHDSGHHIPSKASWRAFFKAYFAAYEPESSIAPQDLPSPSPPRPVDGVESEPASGTVTPQAQAVLESSPAQG